LLLGCLAILVTGVMAYALWDFLPRGTRAKLDGREPVRPGTAPKNPEAPRTEHPVFNYHGIKFVKQYSPSKVDPWNRQTEPKGSVLWEPGTTIRLAFLDGDPPVHKHIMSIAQEWTQVANLSFEIGPPEEAYVRITMDPSEEGDGLVSWAGVACRYVTGPSRPTATLSALNYSTNEADFRRVVLVTFGHILGLSLEWNNPKSDIPWSDEYKRSDEYKNGPGTSWDRNMYAINKEFDKKFVMLPSVPPDKTRGGYSTQQPSYLSEGDKEFVARLYPGTLLRDAVPTTSQ
jgi:hypothetical protein